MSVFFSHPLADISNLPWIALVAVGGSIVLTIVVVVGGLILAHHRQKLWHETARLALEKGQPLPTMGNESRTSPPVDGPSRDLRAGLICIGTGLGLYLFFDTLLGRWMAYLGAIPGFIGVALVLFACLNLLFNRRNPPPADRS